MQNDLIPTAEVARILGCSVATVNRKAAEGKLTPAVEMPGEKGARLYYRSYIEAKAERHGTATSGDTEGAA